MTTADLARTSLAIADKASARLLARSGVFVERDCTITHEGRTFEAGGAVVTPDEIAAYLGKDGVLTDWHGNALGTYRITATWPTPWSYVSSTYSQVYATVGGVIYTGRSAGVGMIFKGRRVATR